MNDTRRTRTVLGVLLLLAIALITIDYRGGHHSPLRGLRGVGATIFGPIESVAAAVVHPVGDTIGALADAPGAQRRADRLEKENQRLREQLRAEKLDAARADQLDRLLGSAGLGGYKVVAARVISAGQGFEDTVTLDVGKASGVRPDMTVMTGDGLVGRITRVGPSTSTVLLATDADSSVGARLEDSQEIGIVQGLGSRRIGGGGTPLRFQLLDSNAPLLPGQRIVTFGSQGDRPYVPGVPVGVVQRVEQTPGSLTRTAFVTPFVHFSRLDVVGIVVAPPKTDPHDAVLPPRPTPTASPTPTPTSTLTAAPNTTARPATPKPTRSSRR
ncbi:MAG TPA: rod shape-determining protein MreC [Streptosporangiaceae bacterium]